MSEVLGFGAFLFLVASFAVWHNRDAVRAWFAREPVDLDAADGIHAHRPADASPSTGSAGRCTTVPYHCATFGHYYQRRSGAWVCRCGHSVTVGGVA